MMPYMKEEEKPDDVDSETWALLGDDTHVGECNHKPQDESPHQKLQETNECQTPNQHDYLTDYDEFTEIAHKIEENFKELRNVKFTIEEGDFWLVEQREVDEKSTQSQIKTLLKTCLYC